MIGIASPVCNGGGSSGGMRLKTLTFLTNTNPIACCDMQTNAATKPIADQMQLSVFISLRARAYRV